MRGIPAGGLVLLMLAGCGVRDYPDDWPDPDPGWLSRKGGCPDLVGDYDSVNSELSWLLSANPDFEVARAVWSEQHAQVEQADDGSWLRITLNLNSRGFDDYRTRMLKFNWESNGLRIDKVLELKVSEDYECSGGWLKGLRFEQAEKVHGMQRKSLKMRRDRSGGLIAGATLEVDQSWRWADSKPIPLGSSDSTLWYRWPKRDPADDETLASMQGVDVHRYSWVNNGTRIPMRFTSFFLEPICVRYFDGDYAIAVHGPEQRRERDDHRPPAPECPDTWGKFDLGEVFRRELTIPAESPRQYRIEWFILGEDGSNPEIIRIADVRKLPVMPAQD
jgi:hypothetical protein